MDGPKIARIHVPVAVPELACHSLPCVVETTGPAPVSEYFFPRTVGQYVAGTLTSCLQDGVRGLKGLQPARTACAAHPLPTHPFRLPAGDSLKASFRGRELTGARPRCIA